MGRFGARIFKKLVRLTCKATRDGKGSPRIATSRRDFRGRWLARQAKLPLL